MIKDNLFHKLPAGPNPPKEVYCVVEIPKGESNKYEYLEEEGFFVLDRVLYESVFFPTEYGFIPQTWYEGDDDPLDIMIPSTHSTFTGCVISARPIGLLKMMDSGEGDFKIIAVPSQDPRFGEVKDIKDWGNHAQKEIENFWENYAQLELEKEIKILGWEGREEAYKLIKKSMETYKKEFSIKK